MHICWFVCFFVLGLQLAVLTNAVGSKEWTCNHHTTSRDVSQTRQANIFYHAHMIVFVFCSLYEA